MAEIVQIDIPGIGLVDARNAASEKTLSDIYKILENWDKKIKPGGPGAPGAPGTSSGDDKKDGPGGLKKAANSLTSKIKFVGGAFVGLGQASANAVASLANLGDSLESVAGLFSSIPVIGTLFQAAAGATERTIKSFNDASQAGASFGGSLNAFAGAASQAGMTLSEFGSLIRSNGQGMLAFGTNTDSGAKNFARLTKQLRSTSGDLYALGFSTAEINQGLASYGALMRLQGQQGKLSNDQLVSGAKRYMRELDALAKITGEDRKAKEDQMKQLATDAQFQMAMAGKDRDVRDSFMKLIGGFGPALGGFVKDYISTGTLTTEANQKMAALLGSETMQELEKIRQKGLSGQKLTDEEQDRLKDIMKKAAQAQSQSASGALAANRDMDDASKGLIEAMQLNDNAHADATAAQNQASAATDGTNEAINKMKERIAAVSNAFTMFLVNSGILNQMMRAFEILVGLVQKYAIPIVTLFLDIFTVAIGVVEKLAEVVLPILTQAFSYLMSGLTGVVSTVDNNVNPAFQFIGEVIRTAAQIINDYVKPALINLAAFIIADVWPVLKFLGETVLFLAENVLWPAFQMIGGVIRDYVYPAFSAVAGFIANNLFPILAMLAAGFVAYYGKIAFGIVAETAKTAAAWLAAGGLSKAAFAAGAAAVGLFGTAKAALLLALPFIKIIAPIVALVGLFAYLYKSGWTFGDAIEAVKDNFYRFRLTLLEVIIGLLRMLNKVTLGAMGINEEQEKAMKENVEVQRKELDEKEKARDQRRKEKAEERSFRNRDQVAQNIENKLDGQSLKLGQQGLGLQQEQISAAEKARDLQLNDPHALLKGVAASENSEFVKPAAPGTPPSAPGTPPAAPGTPPASTPPAAGQTDAESARLARQAGAPSQTHQDVDDARKALVREAEQRRLQEQRTREEQQRQQQQQQQPPEQPPAEKPITAQETLIAAVNRLNTNMERMIALQARSNTILDNQLGVQQNLTGAVSGDLFAYPSA